MKIVEIAWEDASSISGWTRDAATPLICVTVGILLSRTKTEICVAGSLNDAGQQGSVWRIPAGMIRRVRMIGSIKTVKWDR